MAKYQRLLLPRTTKISQDASFLRRTCSFIIDVLILDLFITSPFTPMFSNYMARLRTDWLTASLTGREFGAAMLLVFIVFLYFVLFEYLLGQTIGMMITDLRIEGGTSLTQVVIRNCFILPFPFILFCIIEPIAIAVKRRGVLEYISKTRTLYQRKVLI